MSKTTGSKKSDSPQKPTDLPPDVRPEDTRYDYSDSKPWRVGDYADYQTTPPTLTFYRIEKGWVLCTLHISNPSRRQASGTPARTYGVGVSDSKVYTVGRGPHVRAEVTVYLSSSNIDRLGKYVQLWRKGMSDASSIRDRISSRRAQRQLYRAAGRTSWTW